MTRMSAEDRARIEALIARIALGERAAFAELYQTTSSALLGICVSILDDTASAEDALQDAFVKVWRNADRYAVNGLSPMTWLFTIARNTAIDRLRRQMSEEDVAKIEDHLPAAGPSPEGAAVASSNARRIVDCLAELPEERRAAIQGAYLQGQSYADLSVRFDVPLNTVRSWLRRSLIALRECMAR